MGNGIFWLPFVIMLVYFVCAAIVYASVWRLFEKAGLSGWKTLIPIYNIMMFLDILERPRYELIFLFIPIVNIVFAIIWIFVLSKKFGRKNGMGALLLLLPVIGYSILAFGTSEYQGLLGKRPMRAVPPFKAKLLVFFIAIFSAIAVFSFLQLNSIAHIPNKQKVGIRVDCVLQFDQSKWGANLERYPSRERKALYRQTEQILRNRCALAEISVKRLMISEDGEIAMTVSFNQRDSSVDTFVFLKDVLITQWKLQLYLLDEEDVTQINKDSGAEEGVDRYHTIMDPKVTKQEVDMSTIIDAKIKKLSFGEYNLIVSLNKTGAQQLAEITRQNIGKKMIVILNGEVVSEPIIQEEIVGGAFQLNLKLEKNKLKVIADVLAHPNHQYPIALNLASASLCQ